MSTVIFDFDSTLINCESLEMILQPTLANNRALQQKLHQLTEQGMNGEISFQSSLAQRLQLAVPTRQSMQQFATQVAQYLSPGMPQLIQELQRQRIDIWMLSGGLFEVIMPLAKLLHIPSSQVLAVSVNWLDDGSFAGIPNCDLCSQSKALAASKVAQHWRKPSVMIGDGMTDYEVYAMGLTSHFIAYTEHAKRPSINALSTPQANNVNELRIILQKLFK